MIESYSLGSCMIVDGVLYHTDLKIIKGKVSSDWWRKEGHRLNRNDVEDIFPAKPHILVVGTGYAGQMRIPETLQRSLKREGIHLIAERTQEAVKTFNRLEAEGESVAGAFHLTC